MGHPSARNVVLDCNIFQIENIFMNDALFLALCSTVIVRSKSKLLH